MHCVIKEGVSTVVVVFVCVDFVEVVHFSSKVVVEPILPMLPLGPKFSSKEAFCTFCVTT